jgi:hypothetical protein
MLDFTPLLQDLDTQIAEAEQQAQAAQIRVATLRGERAGVLRVLSIIQNPQPIRTSSEDAKEVPPHDAATATP